jgi:hypothetical protein
MVRGLIRLDYDKAMAAEREAKDASLVTFAARG